MGPRWLLLVTALASSACRIERRPDLPVDGGDVTHEPAVGATSTPVEDSVRAVVSAVGEALQVGDVARVARLTAPSAMLIDQEEAARWTRDDPGAPLPRALSASGDGLVWTLERSHFDAMGAAGLLVNEYRAAVAPGAIQWKAVETFILVRTEEGWRLRHLHRSRGPAGERSP